MTDLAPCPFCGEAPSCGAAYGHGEDEPNSFYFECPNGCSVSKEKPTYDEAVTVWNTRVPAQGAPTREQIARIIAGKIACEQDCASDPSGCGCSDDAADAVMVLYSPALTSTDLCPGEK